MAAVSNPIFTFASLAAPRSGGEKQRLRLAGVFFRIIVLQALHYDFESERDEEDEEETAEFKVLKFNVERKGLEKISTLKEIK